MTENDEELRELLQPGGHDWVTNGLASDYEEEDMPVPIYGANMEYPPGVTSISEMTWTEVEGPMIINARAFKGKLL